MDYQELLSEQAEPVDIEPGSTSYFSKPETHLDPRLFRSGKLIPNVRDAILSILFGYLNNTYQSAESWTHAWIAGSGASYQWAAAREPADLDCLVGIDYIIFRQSNDKYAGFSNQEIANMLNSEFRNYIWPDTEHFLNTFELTFYVNVQTDIKNIKPYAAYSLTDDTWVVEPQLIETKHKPEWDVKIIRDKSMALEILSRYTQALNKIHAATNPSAKLNAENELQLAVQQGAALFDSIHLGRRVAFSQSGQGYLDYANYRWQSHKEMGIVPALKKLKDMSESAKKTYEENTYGAELPTTDTLLRRAITTNK
jgi:hypothetical protein